MRPLDFVQPSPMPMLPYNSFDPPMKSEVAFPALMNGVFRSQDGHLGIFLVNASNKDLMFHAEFDMAECRMPAGTAVNVYRYASDAGFDEVLTEVKENITLEGLLTGYGITMYCVKPSKDLPDP